MSPALAGRFFTTNATWEAQAMNSNLSEFTSLKKKKQNSCYATWGLPDSSVGKEFACNAGDRGSIPGLGGFTGEGNGYALQCSGLENPMDCPRVAKTGQD